MGEMTVISIAVAILGAICVLIVAVSVGEVMKMVRRCDDD